MTNYTFETSELKEDTGFKVIDEKGNFIFGWYEIRKANHSDHIFKSYHITGAMFNGSRYSMNKTHWKRDKSGSVSKAFHNWYPHMNEELQSQLPGFFHKF